MVLLALLAGIAIPAVAVATIVLIPFSDRVTQAVIAAVYFTYVATSLAFGGIL